MRAIRIGIVGFGRIGRSMFRLGYDRPGIEFKAICDSAQPESLIYLLNNSTIEGRFHGKACLEGNYMSCGEQNPRFVQESDPGHIPWDALGVDVVVECTGRFRYRGLMDKHIKAGAKHVVLSTPPDDEVDKLVVRGVNCDTLTGEEKIISCGSSSVHALALMLKVLNEAAGVDMATMTTVHAYTGDQQLSDMARPGLRWSRSAAQNIIPNTTWAPGVVEELIPELKGKLQGLALNVPVPAGSNVDLVTKLTKPLGIEGVNKAMKEAAQGSLKGLLAYTEEPIVSSDAIGDDHSVIFDATATIALEDGLTKTLGWFDNGWAYAGRILDTIEKLVGRAKGGQ